MAKATKTATKVAKRDSVSLADFLRGYQTAVKNGGSLQDVADALGMSKDSVSARKCQLKADKGIVLESLSSNQGRKATTAAEINELLADINKDLGI